MPKTTDLELTPEPSQAVARREAGALAPSEQSTDLVQVIARAAADPNVDAGKAERLYAIMKEERAFTAESQFNEAMSACQAEIPPIGKDSVNPSTNSRYVQLEKIQKIAGPIIFKYGFSMQFSQGDGAAPGMIRVQCVVSNKGHSRLYHMDLSPDDTGAKGAPTKTKIHGQGSTFSYGARYLTKLIFNITVAGEDDDGNQGHQPKPKGPSTMATEPTVKEYAAQLWDLLKEKRGPEQNWTGANRFLVDECLIDPSEQAPRFTPERFKQVIEKAKTKLGK